MTIPVCAFESDSAFALSVADGPVDVGLREDTPTLDDVGGRHPSIE